MPQPQTEERIRVIIAAELDVDAALVTPEATLHDALNADSLETINILQRVEDEFGVQFLDKESQAIATPADLARLVESKLPLDTSLTQV
jgi:acyl carrier protein